MHVCVYACVSLCPVGQGARNEQSKRTVCPHFQIAQGRMFTLAREEMNRVSLTL